MISRDPLATADRKDVYKHAMLWAIRDIINELRLVDAGHLVSYIFTDSHANIEDLVASSCELFLKENTLFYRGTAEAELDWSGPPKVVLGMQFRHLDLNARFRLLLLGEETEIVLEDISYEDGSNDSHGDIERFVRVLSDARLKQPEARWGGNGLLE
nr:hypothetical protein [uncultured Cohaesibacter sp.]